MKPLQLDIVYPKGLTKTLTKIGWSLLILGLGIILLPILTDIDIYPDVPTNVLLIPFALGFVLTGIMQVTNPSEKVGSVTLTNDEITIVNASQVSKILLTEVSEISLQIEGYEMQPRKPFVVYFDKFQSNHYGDSNQLTLKLKNGTETTTQFFLTNEKVESYLRQRLTELSGHHGFKLTSN
jgi:hypothetical protein